MRRVLVALAVFCIVTMSAKAVLWFDSNVYYSINTGTKTATVTGLIDENNKGTIVIPNTISFLEKTYPVVGVERGAFKSRFIVGFEATGSNMTFIGDSAFNNCEWIETVKLGDNVTSIGVACFEDCYQLKNLGKLPDLEEIPQSAFEHCHLLRNITLPETLKTIRKYAFFMSGIDEIVIPASVETIEDRAFGYHEGSDYYSISDLMKQKYLQKVTIYSQTLLDGQQNGVKLFGNQISHYVIGEGVERITNGWFENKGSGGNPGVVTIDLPASLRTIGDYAFRTCFNLSAVNIPGNSQLETIGKSLFAMCKIRHLFIPASVTSIKYPAFEGLAHLDCIVDESSVFQSGGTGFLTLDDESYTICRVYAASQEKARLYRQLGFANVSCTGADGNPDEDVNHDGDVNSLDALKVYKYMQSH